MDRIGLRDIQETSSFPAFLLYSMWRMALVSAAIFSHCVVAHQCAANVLQAFCHGSFSGDVH